MESWIFRNRSRLLAIYDSAPAAALPAPAPAPAPATRPPACRALAEEPADALDGLRQLELLPSPRPPSHPGPSGFPEG